MPRKPTDSTTVACSPEGTSNPKGLTLAKAPLLPTSNPKEEKALRLKELLRQYYLKHQDQIKER